MNVKVHTPKSLKAGSGMGTWKQFLLSLLATTISIVLTFGTAAWVDGRKKAEAKHEMVMMILYDLAGSIEKMEQTDSLLRKGFEQQVEVAAHPDLLEKNPFLFTSYVPQLEYTHTVQQIFSSNIETINTIGNVLFAENVSELYRVREDYKTEICDSLKAEFQRNYGFREYDNAMEMGYISYIQLSSIYLNRMREQFAQCQKMMEVSDKELAVYRQSRLDMYHYSSDSIFEASANELLQNKQRLDAAKQKARR